MYLVTLTGGIAAGKSLVAQRWAELGGVHVDADALARTAVAPGSPGLAAIVEAFGRDVLASDGSLDRPALGTIVFADAARRAELEGITHPEVRRLARERFAAAARADPQAIVVYDVPLFAEAAPQHAFDRVVVVHAPAEQRVQRLIELRGMSDEEARGRVAAQASDDERLAIADDVIDSSGTIEQTRERADSLWAQLRERAGVGGRN